MDLVRYLLIAAYSLTASVAYSDDDEPTTPPVTTNQRMQAVEGSLSPWSGQFNLLYKGSAADHPFSPGAPNPGHIVPPPVVTLSGTVATRYRFDANTTMGLGSGLTTETPFQGPRHTTLADPYLDLAYSSNWLGMHHRVDLQYTRWTNHEFYTVFGYRNGLSVLAESLYAFDSGFTAGWQLAANTNTFAAGLYNSSQQTAYGVGLYPSLEYRLNPLIDWRTVIGILDQHNRNLVGYWRFQHPDVYQTIGVAVNLTRAFYIYFFVKGYPYSGQPIAADRTLCGFSTIINLF